jgi:uridine kinase
VFFYKKKVQQNKKKIGSMSHFSTRNNVIFIGIAGPSGCGKSTYAKHLADHLHSPLYPIQLDHFFTRKLTINHPILGEIKSLEQPDCLNITGFFTLLHQIKQNPKIITQYHRENVRINEMKYLFVIIEGFLLFTLSDEITNLIDIRIFLDSTLSECRLRRYRRQYKIEDSILNENVIVSNRFQQWFDYLVWNEYLKRRDLQIEKAEKIFQSNQYQQRQYIQLDTYIEQHLKQIIEDKEKNRG